MSLRHSFRWHVEKTKHRLRVLLDAPRRSAEYRTWLQHCLLALGKQPDDAEPWEIADLVYIRAKAAEHLWHRMALLRRLAEKNIPVMKFRSIVRELTETTADMAEWEGDDKGNGELLWFPADDSLPNWWENPSLNIREALASPEEGIPPPGGASLFGVKLARKCPRCQVDGLWRLGSYLICRSCGHRIEEIDPSSRA